MKARLALVTVLMLVLVGAVSIVGLAEEGEITASIDPVLNVSFDSTLAIGTLTADYDGTGGNTDGSGSGKLELTVQSNKDYTVQLDCSGNLALAGTTHWRYQIETEYAIWKQITWHDVGVVDGPWPGWVDDTDFSWYDNPATVTWFEADNSVLPYRIGGMNNDTTNPNDFEFMTGNYLPEHDKNYTTTQGIAGWGPEIYNYGADLTLRFFPYLDYYDGYGTRAGDYSGTITVTITNVTP